MEQKLKWPETDMSTHTAAEMRYLRTTEGKSKGREQENARII
jgi:hypothetical protein